MTRQEGGVSEGISTTANMHGVAKVAEWGGDHGGIQAVSPARLVERHWNCEIKFKSEYHIQLHYRT